MSLHQRPLIILPLLVLILAGRGLRPRRRVAEARIRTDRR